jgi:hypothetical protein
VGAFIGSGFGTSASHIYSDEGTYTETVTVTFTDGTAPFTESKTITVADAPLTQTGVTSPSTGTAGTAINAPTVTFTDGNPQAPLTDFTATINWGDGPPGAPDITTGTVAVNTGPGGGFVVTGPAHTYQNAGTYTETVTIADVGGATLTASDTVNVSAAAVPTVVVSGASTTLKAGQTDQITFTFNEVPVGFSLNSISSQNGLLNNLTQDLTDDPSGKTYTATFTPTSGVSGTATIQVAASSYTDDAGNPGTASNTFVIAVAAIGSRFVVHRFGC